MRCAAALFVLLLVACAPAVLPDSSRQSQPILNGAAAASENRVFLLDLRYSSGMASICSAVLVSPRVLVTAAHCADPAFESAASMTIRATNKPDDSMLMNSDMIPVTLTRLHPMWNPSDMNSDYDLAVLLLATAPVGVPPATRIATLANPVGQSVTLVGYGRSNSTASTSGTRRSATTSITAATATTLSFGNGTGLCLGDSGGPSFSGADVVGIHSRGMGSPCGDGVDIRIDANTALIDAFIATNDAALCSMDGRCASGCPAPDPDCPCATDGLCNATCGASDTDCRCAANGMCGATCGAMDPDCCSTDGTCDAACGASDADCCVTDGTCNAACGMSDADCRCVANGTCGATCGTTDPDCCAMDGACDAACGMADPDCGPCAANGSCTESCGATDPDCRCRADGRCDASCAPTDVDCSNCQTDGRCEASCGISDADCLDDGQVCTDASACWGGLCVEDSRGFQFCSRTCAADATCLNDTTCQAGVCRAKRDPLSGAMGGCSEVPGMLLLGVVVLFLRARRTVRPRPA